MSLDWKSKKLALTLVAIASLPTWANDKSEAVYIDKIQMEIDRNNAEADLEKSRLNRDDVVFQRQLFQIKVNNELDRVRSGDNEKAKPDDKVLERSISSRTSESPLPTGLPISEQAPKRIIQYSLIGVDGGKEIGLRAKLEHGGSEIIVVEGDALPGGFSVESISPRVVVLNKGGEKTSLTISRAR